MIAAKSVNTPQLWKTQYGRRKCEGQEEKITHEDHTLTLGSVYSKMHT